MLRAMNTGHDGSITTCHANSARDAPGQDRNHGADGRYRTTLKSHQGADILGSAI